MQIPKKGTSASNSATATPVSTAPSTPLTNKSRMGGPNSGSEKLSSLLTRATKPSPNSTLNSSLSASIVDSVSDQSSWNGAEGAVGFGSSTTKSSGLPPIGGSSARPNVGISDLRRLDPINRRTTVALNSNSVSAFGFTVSKVALKKWKQNKKNSSPFDADMFLPMLKPPPMDKQGKITLVLDIDETLVHASLRPRPNSRPDTVITVDASDVHGQIYVAYRPNVKRFLECVAPLFEVVIFTASHSSYANQLMDTLDPGKIATDRLFREHCTEVNGARVKDLSLLGRPLERMVILDNSPVAYLFQPRNAIPILSWFDDPNDDELMSLLPFLRQLATCTDVYPLLDMYNTHLSEKPRTPPKEQLE